MTPVGFYDNISFGGFDASQPGVANETFDGVMPHCKVFPFIRALVHTLSCNID